MATPLDLGALRREREARQAKKRQRSISPPEASRKAPKIVSDTVTLPSGARLTSFTTTVHGEQSTRKSTTANAANDRLKGLSSSKPSSNEQTSNGHVSKSAAQGSLTYPQGVVKRTWAFRHDRTGNEVKLEEVLEPLSLRTAVLSAFQWDLDWVFSKIKTPINGGSTKCVFIMQAKEPSYQAQMRRETQHMRQWLRLCFPPMEGQTRCMHSKLMLLFHEHKLRIAIPSANLLNFDWGETCSMENSVFMIDLPRLADKEQATRTEFQDELTLFLKKQGLDQDVIDGVQSFDFSATSRFAFVHSLGGISAGSDADHSGLASLARAVRNHDLANDVEIDFAASSIGKLQDTYLSLVHAAASGQNVFEFTAQAGVKKAAQFFQQSSQNDRSIRDKLRIYFPTSETVKASTAGATGTICLSRDWFEDASFPKRCFRDYISTRPGLLSHNKIMYARSTSTSKKRTAWIYHGSANMSESAWGKLVYNKKEKRWHVNCRNWECGVLLPVDQDTVRDAGDEKRPNQSTIIDMKVFDGIAKPPFKYPAQAYEGREPWYFQEADH